MDREAWRAAIHRVPKSQTWLSNWTELNWTCLQQYVIQTGNDLLKVCWGQESVVVVYFYDWTGHRFCCNVNKSTSGNTPSKHLIMMVKYTFRFPASLPLLQLFFLLWEELFLNHTLLGKPFFISLLFSKEHVCMHTQSLQLCLTLCDLMDCNLPGSSVYGDSPARIMEWVSISTSRGSSRLKDRTHISYVSCTGRRILYH